MRIYTAAYSVQVVVSSPLPQVPVAGGNTGMDKAEPTPGPQRPAAHTTTGTGLARATDVNPPHYRDAFLAPGLNCAFGF